MAFSHTRHSTHENGAPSSTTVAVTLASAVASGSLVCVSVGWASNNGDTVTQIKDNNNVSFTLVDLGRDGVHGYSWQTAYLDSISGSPTTITATISTSRTFATIVVGEYIGGFGGASMSGHAMNIQTTIGSTSANAITSGNFTPAVNNCLIYGSVVDVPSNSAYTAGTNFTIRLNNLSGAFDTEDRTLATAASTAATFTTSNVNSGGVTGGMGFKPFIAFPQEFMALRQAIVRASYW